MGENVDPKKMEGKPVRIIVENNEKNGKVYNNIVKIELDTNSNTGHFDKESKDQVSDSLEKIADDAEEGETSKEEKVELPKKPLIKPMPQLQARTKKISPNRNGGL